MPSLLLSSDEQPEPTRVLYLPNGAQIDLAPTGGPTRVPDEVLSATTENLTTKEHIVNYLRTLADWMAGEEGNRELEEEAIRTVDRVIRDHAVRSKIFLVGLSHHRVQKIIDLAQLIDHTEDELAKRQPENMSTYTLILYYNALRSQEQAHIDYVRRTAEAGYPSTYDDPGAKRRSEEKAIHLGAQSPLTPSGRDRVATLLSKVRTVLEERGATLPS